MECEIKNDVEKTFIAIGRLRLTFNSLLEELIDNSLKWEDKVTSNISIKILPHEENNKYSIIEYQDDSDGIHKNELPIRLGVGCQDQQKDLHAHGIGLSCVIGVLQETYNIKDWIIKTGGCIAKGPITDSLLIEDDDSASSGFYMKFRFPTSNLSYLAAHKNSTSMSKYVEGLCGIFGFKYRLYLQSKLLNLNITYIDGSKTVRPVIPIFKPYGNYPINMPDGRTHTVAFGLFEMLNKDHETPDLFVNKTAEKGYFAIFNGKVLGPLKLFDIYDSSQYNQGKLYTYKEWYGELILDARTPGSVTNAIKDGLNEQHPEVQYIINAIKNHTDPVSGESDLELFASKNPTESVTKKRISDIFKSTYGKDGWIVETEFKPIGETGNDPVSIDIIRYHPELKRVYFYELKKHMFDVKAVTQFYGYMTIIENAMNNLDGVYVSDTLKTMNGYERIYVALSDRSNMTPQAELLLQSTPIFNFFTIEDYHQYVPER